MNKKVKHNLLCQNKDCFYNKQIGLTSFGHCLYDIGYIVINKINECDNYYHKETEDK